MLAAMPSIGPATFDRRETGYRVLRGNVSTNGAGSIHIMFW
jgi:hypothetical protein